MWTAPRVALDAERNAKPAVPKNRYDAEREGHLLILIWLGLALSLVGSILLTAFGLIWTEGMTALRNWGFRIGIGLLIVGMSLTVAGL